MIEFNLNEEYLTSVTIVTDHAKDMPEDKQIMAKLKGHVYQSTTSDDHPEFKILREKLGKDGFIDIQRGWWNGDRVLKQFKLNGKIFRKGDQFPSGAAMSGHLKFMKR